MKLQKNHETASNLVEPTLGLCWCLAFDSTNDDDVKRVAHNAVLCALYPVMRQCPHQSRLTDPAAAFFPPKSLLSFRRLLVAVLERVPKSQSQIQKASAKFLALGP
jgi:hypothetical protein